MANEKRLIDANAAVDELKENVCKNCNSHNGIRCDYCWADAVIDFLQESPTVDAVEVVRCKDCIHRHYVDMGDEIGAIGGCGLFGTPMMTCNDFCSYGERREGE